MLFKLLIFIVINWLLFECDFISVGYWRCLSLDRIDNPRFLIIKLLLGGLGKIK